MKIIVDIGGCDHPEKMVLGAVNAANEHPEYDIITVGDSELIKGCCGTPAANFIIEHATDIITNEDKPTVAIRHKPDSSLVRAINILNGSDDAVGLVSGGSTGAVLTATTLLVGRLKGVHRPTLASLLPTAVNGKLVCIADCGANVDSQPEFMAQYALMSHFYVKAILGVEDPVVGLLSNGTEDGKGDERTKAAFKLIKELPINFAGNLEARDAISGRFDVIVSDGFSGNVLIKSVEGTAKMVMKYVKEAMTANAISKLGALLMKKSVYKLKDMMNYHSYGGAGFLGVKKLVVKTHGSSNEISTKASINNIIRMHEHNIIKEIENGIAALATKPEDEQA